jgi:hypothetical protein
MADIKGKGKAVTVDENDVATNENDHDENFYVRLMCVSHLFMHYLSEPSYDPL